jgi:hypothetical protein
MINKINNKMPVECYSRICGYFRPVNQWHKSKQAEFKDRAVWHKEDVIKALEAKPRSLRAITI